MSVLHCLKVIGLALAGLSIATTVSAQDVYPNKSIRLIVPYPPGGSTDILARALANKLTQNLGQPVIVENRPGASGIIGMDALVRSTPDGYTIGITVPSTHTIPFAMGRKLPYNPIKDFTPLGTLARNPIAIVVSASLPVESLKDLVEYSKKHPGELSYGTSGIGTSMHLVAEMLNQVAGIDLVHVPYQGGSPVVQGLLGGQIQVGFGVVPTLLPYVKGKRLKMLAIVDEERFAEAPNVPTGREAIPGFAPATSWLGAFGPPGMAAGRAKQINAELVKAMRDPELSRFARDAGMPVMTSTGEEFAARLREEIDAWTAIVRARKLDLQ
jgi:tripartite-type tricarboxylate transporter receptor subunit TctC